MRLVVDGPFDDLALAGAAGAVLAAIRQSDAGADRRREHGFVLLAFVVVAAGLNGNLERHTILGMNTLNNVRFNKPRLLIVGCGDVGMRLLPLVRERFRVFAVTSQPARRAELRAAGAIPVVADLDRPETLRRLARLAPWVVHLAPPPRQGALDLRTRNLTAILPEGTHVVYISTSGVYGDRGGALIGETAPRAARNAPARRRVDAEEVVRAWAVASAADSWASVCPGV